MRLEASDDFQETYFHHRGSKPRDCSGASGGHIGGVWAFGFGANRHHGPAAWAFVRSRWAEADERFPRNTIVRMVESVKLLDTPAQVEIKTTMGNSVTISDAPPGIQISSPSGMLTINCMQASVSASAIN